MLIIAARRPRHQDPAELMSRRARERGIVVLIVTRIVSRAALALAVVAAAPQPGRAHPLDSLPASVQAAGNPLTIYFIDVEGGQATLVVTPSGESLLIDAGYGRTSRDPDRIVGAMRDAGIDRIDYLLVTHFHP